MDPFARCAEPLARSGEDHYARRAAEQCFDERRRVLYEMLAIVEYDENATTLDCSGDLVDRILLETEIEAESGGGGCRHLCPILDWGKVHKGHRFEARVQTIRNRDGHSCLADAAWADQ
jgi:hypothetical protein